VNTPPNRRVKGNAKESSTGELLLRKRLVSALSRGVQKKSRKGELG